MKKKITKRRDSGILILVLIVATLNFFHNFSVSSDTKNRDFAYAAWQTLTKSTDLFVGVRTKDFFISEHQNDAYETNAGSFFYNTGIRLAQLYNTVNIWPNYSSCSISTKCSLQNVRHLVVQTLPNLERGALVQTDRSKQQVFDWVGINTKPGALASSKIWNFDEYPISASTAIAFIAPFDEQASTASIKLMELKFVTISKQSAPVLDPVLNGYCLVKQVSRKELSKPSDGLRITYWGLPNMDQHGNALPKSLDIRSMAVGTC